MRTLILLLFAAVVGGCAKQPNADFIHSIGPSKESHLWIFGPPQSTHVHYWDSRCNLYSEENWNAIKSCVKAERIDSMFQFTTSDGRNMVITIETKVSK